MNQIIQEILSKIVPELEPLIINIVEQVLNGLLSKAEKEPGSQLHVDQLRAGLDELNKRRDHHGR